MSRNIKQQVFVGLLMLCMLFLFALFVTHAFAVDTTRIHTVKLAETDYEVLVPIEVPNMDAELASYQYLGDNLWWYRYCVSISPTHDHVNLIFNWDGQVTFIVLAWIKAPDNSVIFWTYDEKGNPVPADVEAVQAEIEKWKIQGSG